MVAHPVLLRGLRFGGAPDARPTILRRSDREELLPTIFDELSRAAGELAAGRAPTLAASVLAGPSLRLFQPVHRTFHVALFEAVCDRPGHPRLDPQRIESAGMVVRRYPRPRHGQSIPLAPAEGWRQSGRSQLGWVPFAGAAEAEHDPDPARRPAPSAGHAELDRHLLLLRRLAAPLSETVAPLFTAPPAVCEAAGKTILYGLVPVTSSDVREEPSGATVQPSEVQEFLDPLFGFTTASLPAFWRGQRIGTRDGRLLLKNVGGGTMRELTVDDERELDRYLGVLRLLALALDAFGDGSAPAAIRAALASVQVPFRFPRTQWVPGLGPYREEARPADQALKEQAQVLVYRKTERQMAHEPARWEGWPDVYLPMAWPDLGAAAKSAIAATTRTTFEGKLQALRRRETRFADHDRAYRLRAFVRVRDHDDCPPRTVWGAYSAPFQIAPWFEPTDEPPFEVQLPDLDLSKLSQLRPNVAFKVPSGLQNFLDANRPESLLAGSGVRGASGGLDWLCVFNIPIITICAFALLNVMIMLLNMIFSWLPFVKILIPVPRLPAASSE